MTSVVYDGSFNGFLSAVFEVYEYRISDPLIVDTTDHQPGLFAKTHTVVADQQKAERIITALQRKLTARGVGDIYRCFLSEIKGSEQHLFNYLRQVFSWKQLTECNLTDPHVLFVTDAARKVHREKHRMEAFVRFEKASDGCYHAVIQPDHNVLPLIATHFRERYADQRWLIYDQRRKYGIYYDLQDVTEITISMNEESCEESKIVYDEKEELYQRLWQAYFNAVNIAARKNLKLHIQHMPKRYWRYLTEKKIAR